MHFHSLKNLHSVLSHTAGHGHAGTKHGDKKTPHGHARGEQAHGEQGNAQEHDGDDEELSLADSASIEPGDEEAEEGEGEDVW